MDSGELIGVKNEHFLRHWVSVKNFHGDYNPTRQFGRHKTWKGRDTLEMYVLGSFRQSSTRHRIFDGTL